MATIHLRTADRTAMAAALATAFDTATANAPCTLCVYDGAMPADVTVAVSTQTKLGTLTCSKPIGTSAAGALTFSAITQDDAADANGTAAWARLFDADGVARMDVDVTNTAGTGVLKLNTTTIVAGGPIKVNSFVITMGG